MGSRLGLQRLVSGMSACLLLFKFIVGQMFYLVITLFIMLWLALQALQQQVALFLLKIPEMHHHQ